MAVAKVKKVELIAHNNEKDAILKALEEASLLQVEIGEEILASEEAVLYLQEKKEHSQESLSKANFLLRLIKQFKIRKETLIDSFVPPKVLVKKEDFESVLERFPLDDIYKEMEAADVEIRNAEASLETIAEDGNSLAPWKEIDFDPHKTETEHTLTVLAKLAEKQEQAFLSKLDREQPLAHHEIVHRSAGNTYMVVNIFKNSYDGFIERAKDFEFELVSLPEIDKSIKNTIKVMTAEASKLREIKRDLLKVIQGLSEYEKELIISRDLLLSDQAKLNVEEQMMTTKSIFVLQGWVKAKEEKKFRTMLSKITDSSVLTFKNPGAKDNPPIVLENASWLKPFESVTALYGMPQYKEIDPTPYMAPFFLLFFGLVISDVIYGLVLALLSWLLQKSTRFSANTKNMLGLFIYGGIAAAILGVFTGNWLSLPTQVLPVFLQSLIVIEPLSAPTLFLVITIILGLVQIYFGMFLKFIDLYLGQSFFKALKIQLPPLMLLPGLTLLIAAVLGLPLSSQIFQLAVILALLGAVGIVIFSAESGNIFARLGTGLYNLFSMTSLLGDAISYGRIMALGLATFLIGSAINTIFLSDALFQSLAVKVVLGVTILPIAHFLNLAVTTIAAFVHPARLQYVEFFSKFFEGGGSRFKPLALKTDNIILEKSANR